MENFNFHFKSKPGIFFYLGIIFILIILFFTGYNLLKQQLTLGGFFFLNILAFVISYSFTFRFSCGIDLTEESFSLKYYFKDEKSVQLSAQDIVHFEKFEDSVHRYHKKFSITTIQGTLLIRYNISDSSDEDLIKLLRLMVEKNKRHIKNGIK